MQGYTGSLIVLEGSDGSGKGTQFRLLAERLEAVGYAVEKFDFPRYEEPSSYFVQRYLNGDYGPASQVGPYTASFFYALDRFEAAPAIKKALKEGRVVICNRYTGSNMAHQGSKFVNAAEQRGFFVWADSLEYQLLGIPRPAINVYLRVPAEVSYKLIDQKAARDYTNKPRDEHEKDIEHLRTSVAAYDLLCQLFPKDFIEIDCAQDGRLLDIPTINNKIWVTIKPYLPERPQHTPSSKVVRLRESEEVSISGPSILPSAELKRTVPQLELTFKNISGLIRRSLITEPSILVTDIGETAKSKYYQPASLSSKDASNYINKLDQIKKISTALEDRLNRFIKPGSEAPEQLLEIELQRALASLKPLAVLSTIGLSGSEKVLVNLAEDLSFSHLAEAGSVAASLTSQLKKKLSKPSHSAQSKELSEETIGRLSDMLGQSRGPGEEIMLTGIWPLNEFEVLADLLYPRTTSAKEQLIEEIGSWTFKQKSQAVADLLEAGNQNFEMVLRNINYRFDIVSSGIDLLELLSYDGWRNIRIQAATPRLGYDIPELVERAGLEEEYSESFDLSLALFSDLQAAGHHQDAQYAALSGHKVRWQADIDAGRLMSILRIVDNKGVSRSLELLLRAIQEVVTLAHPVLFGLFLAAPPDSKKTASQRREPARKLTGQAPAGKPQKTAGIIDKSQPAKTGRRRHRGRGRPRK